MRTNYLVLGEKPRVMTRKPELDELVTKNVEVFRKHMTSKRKMVASVKTALENGAKKITIHTWDKLNKAEERELSTKVCKYIHEHPGVGTDALAEHFGIDKINVIYICAGLEDSGRIKS